MSNKNIFLIRQVIYLAIKIYKIQLTEIVLDKYLPTSVKDN